MQGQGDNAARRRPAAADRRLMVPAQAIAAPDRVADQDVARWRALRSGRREEAAR